MATFAEMKQRYQNSPNTIGQQLKISSDFVMQETWKNDIQTKQCYIYDFYHDDQKELQGGENYHPELSDSKIPVSLKFIVKEYKSASKDDPEYHIQFEPDVWNSMSCKPSWFEEKYCKLGIQFPIGLYVDIPDDRGVYWKWIVFYNESQNQFPKFGIVKCNYYFMWNEGFNNDGTPTIRKMWGAERTANSYTSGIWSGDKTTTFDEQDKFWLPYNDITSEIMHDMRFIISMPRKKPFVYKITKVSDTVPKGIIAYTLKQTEFNQFVDYVNLDTQEMIADYYKSKSDKDNDTDSNVDQTDIPTSLLSVEDGDYTIMVGGEKVITAKNNVEWSFKIDGELLNKDSDGKWIHDTIQSITYDDKKAIVKLNRVRKYKGHIITIEAIDGSNSSSIDLEIVV